jgi:dipeptidyl aminopeptidase/acylaminoacyl peptidase
LTNYSFTEPQRLSDLNLHILDTFNWGHTKLFEWKYRDSTNQGYLVLPDNYDSTKAYPVFVYFYDQMSDRMNRFYMPELTHRPVNQIYMDNYIMFFPDITYIIGRPGDDAVDCILSGCRALAAQGIIDTNRSCVQGHSWGGYQTAYIAAKPTFFSAACAGAPVGNMTSAYSGIRLGSGRTRQFQYETQQSRIGGNIFDSLDAYIRNSPIFTANQATTPLLIGHGDVDEAVPYQQGVELYMAFRRAQKPCWLLQYVNEPHWQERYWNKVDYSVKMKEFFDHYCLGKPEPEWMKGRPYKGEVNGK